MSVFIDRQALTAREQEFLQLVGSLGAPLSDARALELFHMSVDDLMVELERAGLDVPASLRQRPGDAELADALEPLDALPLFEQIIPQRSAASQDAVAFLSETYGLDPGTASKWELRTDRLQRVAVSASFQFPGRWAGAKLDHEHQRLIIAVADVNEAQRVKATITAEPDIDVRVVSHSLKEIRGDIEAVSVALGLQGDSLDEADQTPAQRYVVVADDFDRNGIVVTIDPRVGDVAPIISTIRSLTTVPTDIRVEPTDLSLDCTPSACGTLRGGIKATTVGCTYGFNMWNGGSTKRASTAGHCVDDDYRGHNGDRVGQQVWQSTASQGIDVELVSIENPGYWNPGARFYTDGINNYQVSGTVSQSAAAYDSYLCHTGRTLYEQTDSAQSCGRLTAKYATSFSNVNSLGKIEPCQGLGGDSGGPVWDTAGQAFGFHKGSNSDGACYFSWASRTEQYSGWRPWVSGGK